MDLSAASALAVLSKLRLLGFCAGLQIPDDAADPSEVFDTILAAFLREVYPGERDARPLPAALGDGRRVDLFRLFTAVRAAGGYAVASSPSAGAGFWAAAAGSAALAAPVKLLYAKYLGALERWIQRLPEAQPPPCDEMQELLCVCGANEEPSMDRNGALKRKREDIAGMLDWVRGLAQTVSEEGAITAGLADGYFPVALAAREAVARKRARRASVTNGALLQLQEIGCRSTTCARIGVQCSKKLQLVQHPGSDTNKLTRVVAVNGSSMVVEQESSVNGQLKHSKSQQRNKLLVGSNYQAEVPQWTGAPPENYGDPETLKWLGTKIWPPENGKKPYHDPIGKGREYACSCSIPRSVECVRFHIAERRVELRRELGSAFYQWGFERMGEEVALSWTDEEEASFKAVMQTYAPCPARNLWSQLQSSLRWKPRKELVSYYFNCFLLRRRCYQNRIAPKKIDSDDEEETEFRFLGNRMRESATKYDSTKHTVCVESTHCMDLDDE